MAEIERLEARHAQLVVVDVQEKLLPHIHEHETVVAQIARMIRAARELELPVTVSEQYPQGLGPTASAILEVALDSARVQKLTFSVCRDAACHRHLAAHARPQVLLVGIEAHVCVQQTALDLLKEQMQPFVLADAVGSRRALDRDIALERMRSAGVVVTTVESAIYEMMERAGTERFRRMLPLVR